MTETVELADVYNDATKMRVEDSTTTLKSRLKFPNKLEIKTWRWQQDLTAAEYWSAKPVLVENIVKNSTSMVELATEE